jgi:hypothetical protein
MFLNIMTGLLFTMLSTYKRGNHTGYYGSKRCRNTRLEISAKSDERKPSVPTAKSRAKKVRS